MNAAPAPRGTGAPSGRLAGYRRVFRNRRFGWFFLAQATGDAGYAVYAIAVPWLALRISGSLAVAGVVLGVEFGVYALSFLAGPVVDRLRDLRTVLLLGYPAQGALALGMGFLAATGALSVPVLLVLVVAISGVWTFTWTASNAAPPGIVGADDLFAANGLLSAVSGGNQLAGYAAGAAAILLVGPAEGLVLYGFLNLAAAAFSLPVRVPQSETPGGWYEGLRDGFREFVRPDGRPLVSLAVTSAIEGFAGAGPVLLILAVANGAPSGGSRTYGILFTAFALGTIVGSIVLGSANPRRRLGDLLLGATAVEGGLVIAAVLAEPLGASAAPIWFGVGALDVVFYQVALVYLQATSAPGLVGRTITNAYLFRGSGRALGAVAFGVALGVLPVLTTGVVDGLGLLGIAGAAALGAPALRRLSF